MKTKSVKPVAEILELFPAKASSKLYNMYTVTDAAHASKGLSRTALLELAKANKVPGCVLQDGKVIGFIKDDFTKWIQTSQFKTAIKKTTNSAA